MAQTTDMTPLKAIRKKCLDCSAESSQEVKQCWAKDCPLYPYRLGKNPNRKGRKLTEEQKRAASLRLKKWRESQN